MFDQALFAIVHVFFGCGLLFGFSTLCFLAFDDDGWSDDGHTQNPAMEDQPAEQTGRGVERRLPMAKTVFGKADCNSDVRHCELNRTN